MLTALKLGLVATYGFVAAVTLYGYVHAWQTFGSIQAWNTWCESHYYDLPVWFVRILQWTMFGNVFIALPVLLHAQWPRDDA